MVKSTENILNTLEGRVSGVQINADGAPGGGGTSIQIRGMSTIGNNSPLYVIDGVPTMENLNSINPNDIESMQVLKDASSASIYGARAAGGVIIITTKKGAGNKLGVEVNISAGLQTVAKQFVMLNATQWGQVYWQANRNAGLTLSHPFYGDGNQPVNGSYLDAMQQIPFSDTNWQDEIYSPSWTQNYSASVTNSTDKSSILFSINHTRQDGLIDQTFYNRFSVRLNSTYNLSRYIHVGENLMLAKWNDLGVTTQSDLGLPYTAMRQHPAIPVYDSNGNFTNPMTICSSDIANPVHALYNQRDNQNESYRVLGNIYLEILPVRNLSIKTNLGIERMQYYNQALERKLQPSDVNSASSAFGQGDTQMWTNTANYSLQGNKHKLSVLGGTESISYNYSALSALRRDYAFENDNYMVLDAGEGVQTNGGNKSSWALFSLFGKIDYNFVDRYLLAGTIRRDASSRFGKNNNYGIFPSLSGAWRITEESFIPKKQWLDYAKLRVGWGTKGNSEIDGYATYSMYGYDVGNAAYDLYGSNTNSVAGIKVIRSGNPDLKWETTSQTNIGLDAALFNNLITIAFDYYWKKTTDMLTIPPTLSVMGENAAMWMNTGDMENKGFEFVADYVSKKYGDFSYGATLNVSQYKNKLVRLNDMVFQTGGDQRNIVGQPLGVFYGYVADGIFLTDDDVLNHANQQGKDAGRIRYRDLDHSGTIDENDQCIIGDPNSDLFIGLNLQLTYKRFTLSCFLNSELGFDIYNTTKRQLDFLTFGDKNTNRGLSTLDAWTPDKPDASVPALTLLDNNNETRMSTYFIEDGTYLKIKNLRLGYPLSDKHLKKLNIASLDIYGQVDNLYTFTNYSGLEPALPVSRFDNAPYPIARTFTIGLNIKF
jgi:TonB-linked SusC/RagA family outer membrane protein